MPWGFEKKGPLEESFLKFYLVLMAFAIDHQEDIVSLVVFLGRESPTKQRRFIGQLNFVIIEV